MKSRYFLVTLILLITSLNVPSRAADFSCQRLPETFGMGREPIWTTSGSKDLKFVVSWSFRDPENCIVGMPDPNDVFLGRLYFTWNYGIDFRKDFQFPAKWTVTRSGEMALVSAETEFPIDLLLSLPNRNLDGYSIDLMQTNQKYEITSAVKVRKSEGFDTSLIYGKYGIAQLWGNWFSKNQGLHTSECKPIMPDGSGYVKTDYKLSYRILSSGLKPVIEITIDEPSNCIFLVHAGPIEKVKGIAKSGGGGYLADHPFWSGEAPTFFNSILDKPNEVLQIGTGDFSVDQRSRGLFLYRDEDILGIKSSPKMILSHFDNVRRDGSKVIITSTLDGSQINPSENGNVTVYTGFYTWYSLKSSYAGSAGWRISYSGNSWTARYSSGGFTPSGSFMSYTTDALKIPISELFLSPEAKAEAKSSDAKPGDQLSKELADYTLKEFSDFVAQQEADAKAAAAKTYKSKISILCAKGSSVKKVTALKPKCPPGFKQKPTKR
jgi:hypothetical protein